jgi:hypothetical protein
MPKTELLTREQMAHVLMLSPNRLSELTRAGHIQAASIKPLRYDRWHAASCYRNYRLAVDTDPEFLRRVEAQTSIVDNKMSDQPIIRNSEERLDMTSHLTE